MQESIFTKIINGDVPGYRIYEDEHTVAILNINPIQYGHVLVVPREQVDHFEDLDDEVYQALMATVKKLAIHIKEELQVERIGVKIEGFEVPHAHVHLVPCNTENDLKAHPYEADEEELSEVAERLAY